jgi:hypothetical protein
MENKVGNYGADYYKMVYRLTDHFRIQHELIRDELKGYSSSIETTEDQYNVIGPYKLLEEVTPKMDYNDYYYYKLCLHLQSPDNPISIVTHDQDFKFRDVEIITDSSVLKNLRY